MQPQFSPPITRLDAVLWFLRVQLWLSVVALITGLFTPWGFFLGLGLQNLTNFGLPILVLSLFPRILASAMLGHSTHEELSALTGLRPLVGRCVGAALFVGSLGRAATLTLSFGYEFFTRGNVGTGPVGIPRSYFFLPQLSIVAVPFFLGFVLAFGPAIRDNFRAR